MKGIALIYRAAILTAILILPFSGRLLAEKFEYKSQEYRDPFVSASEWGLRTAKLGAGDLRLEGIIKDENSAFAILNGEIVQEGGELGGFKILEIHDDRVTVDKGEEIIELELRTGESGELEALSAAKSTP